MKVSLTELRQRLFELADRVIDTGEAVEIERRGVCLRIVRDAPDVPQFSRLSRLVVQDFDVGPPLHPQESPAAWSELATAFSSLHVAEPGVPAHAASASLRATTTAPKKRRR